MKRWEWGFGNGEWGLGNGGWGVGTGGSEMGIREWGVGTQDNVYKRGCEKMVIIFSQPFFTYSISW